MNPADKAVLRLAIGMGLSVRSPGEPGWKQRSWPP